MRFAAFCAAALATMFVIGFAAPIQTAGAEIAHPNAKTLPIQFTGSPWYVEDYVTGGAVSDYGSHYGIKANLTDNSLGKMMFYTCLTSLVNGEIDRGRFDFISGGNSILEGSTRTVRFEPWGWTEESVSGSASASLSAMFIGTDALLINVELSNLGGSAQVSPVFSINGNFETKNENMMSQVYIAWQLPMTYASLDSEKNTVSIQKADQFLMPMMPEAATTVLMNLTTCRTFAPSFEIASLSQSPSLQSYAYEIRGKEVQIGAGETKEFWMVVGFDQSDAGAKARAESGKALAGNSPSSIMDYVSSDWAEYLEGTSNAHLENAEYEELFYLAKTALRQELYAPRNLMTQWCSVPCKPHFNFFWCWDTPFHTLGQSEFEDMMGFAGTDMAQQNMYTQFTGQNPLNGEIYIVVDDSFTPAWPPGVSAIYSQPPVHGWTIPTVYERSVYDDAQSARDFLQVMYDKGAKYVNFYQTYRDTNFDGLCEFNSAMETGWDDTPRYTLVNPTGTQIAGFMLTVGEDAVDLSSWLYIYMMSLSNWAEVLGNSTGASEWREKADNLAALVEEKMWCEEDGCWYDLNHASPNAPGGYEFVKVATPAMWFPAFAGICKNETRIHRVIEQHVLNPDEFWGTYPIPTVAYNSPHFDAEQDGYYWCGQVWTITAYTTLEMLYKYGYEQEAEELKTKLFDMMKNQGGIYENYDPDTGEPGWGSKGVGDPTCFQFGWSSAFVMQMSLERYERSRAVMPAETEISGYIKSAKTLDGKEDIYSIETGEYEVPRVVLKSLDGSPLSESKRIRATFSDEYGNLAQKTFQATIKGTTITVQAGKSYQVSAKQKFIPGFEIAGLCAAIAILGIALKRKKE